MAKYRKTLTLTAGSLLAILLLCFGFLQFPNKVSNEAESDLLMKYKSTIPMVTAPLYILAKGMNLVDK